MGGGWGGGNAVCRILSYISLSGEFYPILPALYLDYQGVVGGGGGPAYLLSNISIPSYISQHTAAKIPFMYFQTRNCAVSVPVAAVFMCL